MDYQKESYDIKNQCEKNKKNKDLLTTFKKHSYFKIYEF